MTEPSKLEVHVEGDALYGAMLADIAGARHSVRLECYILADDEVGGLVMDSVAQAARRGVEVVLRVDAIGSWGMISRSRIDHLRDAGVHWQWARPWSWRRPWRFHLRNHRKLLVVDSDIAYLGGFNLDRRNSSRSVGVQRWRDTHVRIDGGSLVLDAARLFDRYPAPFADRPEAQRRRLVLMTNRTRQCRHRLRCAFTEAFAGARFRLWLTTPYFVPDRRSQRALVQAAKRGVDVRLLVPGKNDVPLAQWAARAAYAPMLAAGVRIFEFQGRVLHAKTALVDEGWATVGTANFDYRSFFLNDEINLLGQSPALNDKLAAQFEADLTNSREVLARAWRSRPWYFPILEAIGWWARRFL